MNIIVVHNNQNILEIIKTALNDAGYDNVVLSLNVNDAFSKMKETNFDLVMANYNMEYISGLYFLKMIRGDDKFKTIKFIMMFVDLNRDLFMNSIEEGADAFIHKPYDSERLKKVIDSIFA
jgi:two-component system chemotaxis response regulator CheY